jgi:hypothetical protein
MAAELQHNMDKNFGVHGVVKPRSDLLSILIPGIEDIRTLQKMMSLLSREVRGMLVKMRLTITCHKFRPS